MNRNNNRPTGVKLVILDLAKVKADALALARKADPEVTGVNFSQQPLAAVLRGGVLYVVGSEGVGQAVTADSPLEIEVYGEKPNSIAIFPFAVAKLTPDEVFEAATGPEVDLAVLIRSFGARLESNFSQWYRKLSVKTLGEMEADGEILPSLGHGASKAVRS